MNTRLLRRGALATLPLLVALLGCALADVQTPGASTTKVPINKLTPAVHEVAQTATLTGGNTGPVTATCPQGQIALGGGWSVPTQQARVLAAKLSGASWSVTALPLGHPATTMVTAYVECLDNVPGAVVTQRAKTYDYAPTPTSEHNDHLGGLVAICAAGETLVGGGFDLGAPGDTLELEATFPSDDLFTQMWAFSLRNYDTAPHTVTYYAECLSGAVVSTSYPSQGGSFLFNNPMGSLSVACPAGAVLAGGGFQYGMSSPGPNHLGNLYSLHATASGWQGQEYTLNGFGLYSLTARTVAVCLTVSNSTRTLPHP
jgi:hypothetical protein